MRNKTILMNLIVGLVILSLTACGGGQSVGEPTQATTPPGAAAGETSAATEPGVSVAGLCDNPLFPVVQGSTWTYTNTGAPTGDFSYTDAITAVREDGFTLTTTFDIQSQQLMRTQEWSCTPEGLVALTLGGANAAGLSTQNMTAEFTTSDVMGVTIPSNITPGMTWSNSLNIQGTMKLPGDQTATATGAVTMNFVEISTESVAVPAGTFDATRVDVTSNFNITASFQGTDIPVQVTGTSTLWYAPGVGLVKSIESGNMGGAPISATTELQSYSIP